MSRRYETISAFSETELEWLDVLSRNDIVVNIDNDEWYVMHTETGDIITRGNGPYGLDLLFVLLKKMKVIAEMV